MIRIPPLPAWLENDGNAAAVGESLFGVGRWAQNFAHLDIAAGFGGIIQAGEERNLRQGRRVRRPAAAGRRAADAGTAPHARRRAGHRRGQRLRTPEPARSEWPAVDEWITRVIRFPNDRFAMRKPASLRRRAGS
ncbi:hypothetical protein [Methylobacterium sp. ID0610]|uniref:hypothetical protein n=1 Tax=Methylobacterium carpenticola TaxID=3344827 RepID=UPI0036A4659B